MKMLKVNQRNFRKRCEIRSKLAIKAPEPRKQCRSGIFIVNFEPISQLFPVFLSLTLSMYLFAGDSKNGHFFFSPLNGHLTF